MNILAVGAHFDDVELGCGATLKKLKDEGNDIYIFVGTESGFVSINKQEEWLRTNETAYLEGQKSAQMIGAELFVGGFETFSLDYSRKLNSMITALVQKYNIDCVFTNWSGDCHHDHWGLARAVFHGAKHVPRILAYRSNWQEADETFKPNFFVDVTKYWDFKVELLKSYETEFDRVGDNWLRFCKSDSIINGLRSGCELAEGFYCIRWTY